MAGRDKSCGDCRSHDNPGPTLPRAARLPINRCNLQPVILGSLSFQRHPTDLHLDGVAELHAELFALLDRIGTTDRSAPIDGSASLEAKAERAAIFRDYVAAHFCLDHLEDAGLSSGGERGGAGRARANWMRVLRGWSFDADGREGAVLKGWVESRFGLLARFHGAPLRDFSAPAYRRYQEMRSAGLYGTNALEAQLDLLYAYTQYEFSRQQSPQRSPQRSHVTLYRGTNGLGDHEVLGKDGRRDIILLNNLSSFTSSRERAGEFGDYILEAEIPVAKIFFHCALLPGVLKGEDEHLVIGGACEVTIRTL